MRLLVALLLGMMSALPSRNAAAADAAPLRIVTSFTILSDLTHEIGAEWVSVQPLVGPDGDAHVYQPTPADVRSVGNAHIVILNGLGFEGWMNRLLDSAQFHGTVVIATDGVVARKRGGHPDPHAWQDPRNIRTYVTNIGNALEQALPAHSAQFEARKLQYLENLEQLDRTLRHEFAAIPPTRRRVITTHDAFGYFGAAYAIEFLPVQGWTTESEPSAAAVGQLVEQAKARKAVGVFLENVTDPRMMRQLARDTGLTVGGRLYSDALARPGEPASTYLGMIRTNADTLLGVMRKETMDTVAP
ncbi:MAG: zinc/manganese transport system substrate-binding protein [Gammaproteobacteria bacterium]|jgi:zinc/manganese transport system substrate-binding protein|nr:zinc/manganese transport system substrate-binding protein [Gammaproteobacteria bacterium]